MVDEEGSLIVTVHPYPNIWNDDRTMRHYHFQSDMLEDVFLTDIGLIGGQWRKWLIVSIQIYLSMWDDFYDHIQINLIGMRRK